MASLLPSATNDKHLSRPIRRPTRYSEAPCGRRNKSAPLHVEFPPQNVLLHPEDANSKVFQAIARSFLSVDNCAMTIKDLAEMTVKFGLVAQNVGAASQAITTYIRLHLQRCTQEDDVPLLCRHNLSGTRMDDDLVPALYSTSGGSHCSYGEGRATNFRRGTQVWFLSRATGAPCPFTRAGIRLCEYTEAGKPNPVVPAKELRRRREGQTVSEICGQKRKRPFRTSSNNSESDFSSEAEKPPPKVKLTLKLKPLSALASVSSSSTSSIRKDDSGCRTEDDFSSSDAESDNDSEDSMSVESFDELDEVPPVNSGNQSHRFPPCHAKVASIPCYSPPIDEPYDWYPPVKAEPAAFNYQRSPSLPYSIASPPPDSDEDTDDQIIPESPRSTGNIFVDDEELDWDADSESEEDDLWDSPGPRSPSVSFTYPEPKVKQEVNDVRNMLDAWDDYDVNRAFNAPVKVKIEAFDSSAWDEGYRDHDLFQVIRNEQCTLVKKEESESDPLSPRPESPSGYATFSTPSNPSSLQNGNSSPLWDGSHSLNQMDVKGISNSPTIRLRSKAEPSILPYTTAPRNENVSGPPDSERSLTSSLASLIETMTVNPPNASNGLNFFEAQACISPKEMQAHGVDCSEGSMHTCRSTSPAISAAQVEGISVYQMQFGPYKLLRRMDTDFVNLLPIAAHSGTPLPVLSTISNAALVSKGSSSIIGTWVPLSFANSYVRDHQLARKGSHLEIFLAETLYERFPLALQDTYRSSARLRSLQQFGPHFWSTIQSPGTMKGNPGSGVLSPSPSDLIPRDSGATVISHVMDDPEVLMSETPLSPTEQEIFHSLCASPEWDKDNSKGSPTKKDEDSSTFPDALAGRHGQKSLGPLRRSKRVAGMAVQSAVTGTKTARSRRRGSR